MGIQDRDWYRESFKPKKTGFWYSPKKMLLASLVVILFSALFPVFLEYLVFNNSGFNSFPQSLSSPPLSSPLPASAPFVKIPAAPSISDRSKVVYSTSTSQTIQYYKRGGVKYIEAEVNGVLVDVIIDTGASNVSLNADTIKKLGIQSFSEKGFSSTAGGLVDVYLFKCNSIKVGTMEVKNVGCSYIPTLPHNLLGNSFLSHFSYSFNESDNTITLTCLDCEPDNSIYGMVEMNGKKYLYYKSGRLEELRQ